MKYHLFRAGRFWSIWRRVVVGHGATLPMSNPLRFPLFQRAASRNVGFSQWILTILRCLVMLGSCRCSGAQGPCRDSSIMLCQRCFSACLAFETICAQKTCFRVFRAVSDRPCCLYFIGVAFGYSLLDTGLFTMDFFCIAYCLV